MIPATIGGQTIYPGRKTGFPSEGRKVLIHPNKDVLCQVFGNLVILDHAQDVIKDWLFVFLVNLEEILLR
jgi:hypothetical protein